MKAQNLKSGSLNLNPLAQAQSKRMCIFWKMLEFHRKCIHGQEKFDARPGPGGPRANFDFAMSHEP